MSMFACEECGFVENTATSRYWARSQPGESGRALCSLCDPKMRKWHGCFPRHQPDLTEVEIGPGRILRLKKAP